MSAKFIGCVLGVVIAFGGAMHAAGVERIPRPAVPTNLEVSLDYKLPRGANLEKWGPVGEVVSLWLHTAQSRAEWTRQLIGRLERGLYRMADDH